MKLRLELILCAGILSGIFLANSDHRVLQYEEQALNPASYVLARIDQETASWPAPGPELRRQLEIAREKTRIPPVDARMDPVWKAIPALNGIELDVDKTYEAAEKAAGKPFSLIYRQIPPQKTLKDLPPAPIYRGNPGKQQIALMINVAWGEEYLPQMIQTLRACNAGATFFLDGSWVKKHPAEAKAIVDAGFEIGNHAYSHPDMRLLSREKQNRQMTLTSAAIFQATGKRPDLFAPPSGSFSQLTVDLAAENGMKTILWSADTIDWQKPAPSTIIRRILSKASSGTMVLMHPTDPTAKALPELTRQLMDRGYQLVSVSQLLDQERPAKSGL